MRLHKSIIRLLTSAVILCGLSLQNCMDVPRDNVADRQGDSYNDIYADKRITAFSFVDPAVSGVINEAESTITVYVTYGTDVTSLAAEFTTNAESVSIYGREQRSGITVNDFSEKLYYIVTAKDGSSREYTVWAEHVTIARFSVSDPALTWDETVDAVIDHDLKKITVQLPFYMDITYLVPGFDAYGNVTQISGEENDFTDSADNPFVYEVTDNNGISREYSVVVEYNVTVEHVAGAQGGEGNSDGTGRTASFSDNGGITSDFTNLYVADTGNHTIRKIEIATGVVTTIAGTACQPGSADGKGTNASFNSPNDITTDGTYLYVADTGNNKIRRIAISSGIVTTIAGTGGTVFADDETGSGDGITSTFNAPKGITTNGQNLFIADTGNHKIRKINLEFNIVSTLAGTGSTGSAPDSDDTLSTIVSTFNSPESITTDGVNNLYIADTGNSMLRKIIIYNGNVSTIVVSGSLPFISARGITTDGTNIYFVTYQSTIRRLVVDPMVSGDPDDDVITEPEVYIAGNPGSSGNIDGFGTASKFSFSRGITINGTNLYISDSGNNTIRAYSMTNKWVGTFCGSVSEWDYADGEGVDARFTRPYAVTTDGSNLYIADTFNQVIRKIDISTGVVSTFAGIRYNLSSVDDATGISDGITSTFNYPYGITSDGANLYVTDTNGNKIRKIVISTGVVSTIAGTGGTVFADDATGISDGITSTFNKPYNIATDGTNLYVTDYSNRRIRKIVISSGAVTTIAGTGVSGSDDDSTGMSDGITSTFAAPFGITMDNENLYVTDYTANKIRKIAISSGVVSTMSPTGLSGPSCITTDGTNLYVADSNNFIIRKIIISTETVSTIAGISGYSGNTDGYGSAARFNSPAGIVFNYTDKKLYVADTWNSAIRVINP